MTGGDGGLYELVLDAAAAEQGAYLVCVVVSMAGVRIVESGHRFYRVGSTGVVLRKRLVPVQR